ncbi:hypothetical protein B0H13DRAFT_1875303 [Mycena leptocephala]|nr:hypothetical protein B0H13DRAFT_1875303 [Mycena leptocephala]
MLLTGLAPVLSLVLVAAVQGQFTQACSSATGICFNQVFDPVTNVSIGVVLPLSGSFCSDFIAQVTTPIPYGASGFSLAPAEDSDPSIRTFQLPTPTGAVSGSTMLIQQTVPTPGNSRLVPIATGASISMSPLSKWTATTATMVFRCQNCFASTSIAAASPVQLTVFRTNTPPTYPVPGAFNGTVSTDGAMSNTFHIADSAVFESKDYEAFLSAASLA